VNAPARLLVVALDSCDVGTMTELARRGRAPTFQRLLEDGARATIRTPPGVFEGAVWPSFWSALSPLRHRLYSARQLVPGSYDKASTYPHHADGTPFWSRLSDAGCRVAVVDVPVTYLTPGLNGLQVLEWGVHEHYYGFQTWPPSVTDEIRRRFGTHPVGSYELDIGVPYSPDDVVHRANPIPRAPSEARALASDLVAGVQRKSELSLGLLAEGAWDLFLASFSEAHMVGHQLWHLHDPSHPWFDVGVTAETGDPVARVYEALDRAVGDHLARAGDDGAVIVLLSHGMGPHYGGTHLLDHVLRRLELANELRALRRPSTRVLHAARGMFPRPLRSSLDSLMARTVRRRLRRQPAPVDPDPTTVPRRSRRWYRAPNNFRIGAVQVNLAGREPSGLVCAEDYDDVCRYLTRELLQVVNVDTGERAVQRVWRCDDLYGREGREALPDLFVEWNASRPIETVYSPTTGIVQVCDEWWRTGEHRDGGMLMATGPCVEPGIFPELRTEDIGPTIADGLGVTLEDVDGRVAGGLAGMLRTSADATASS
jgi:predicted AlkP superfamily phosphohydrolase/phosphomutase